MLPRTARGLAAILGLLGGMLALSGNARSADPNALWNIVHGQCVPDWQQHRDTKPCAEVNLKRGVAAGYAVLKDIRGETQFLLIPTRRVSGIESPSLRAPRATNYFAEAWQARRFVEQALNRKMPRDTLSLAVNSQLARSQNQLHIHIDCIRADVRDALARERSAIGGRWTPLPILLSGHRYRAIRITGGSLGGQNPFMLLAWGVPGARADMGDHTLAVVGMWFAPHIPGFVILDDRADPANGDNAGGEDLQDHACALGR